MMKIGTHYAYWNNMWAADYVALCHRAKKCGLDVLEVGAGDLVAMSDAELEAILSRAVFMDGGAARTLVERGFGDKIGIRTLKKQNIFVNAEIFESRKRDDGTYIRVPSRIPVGCWFDLNLRDGAEVLSEFLTPDGKKYPALCYFENELGGKVVIYPAQNDLGDGFFTHHRVSAFKDILNKLSPELPRIDCHSYTLAVVKRTKTGDRYYFVADLSADKTEEIKINGTRLECNMDIYESCVYAEKDGNSVFEQI